METWASLPARVTVDPNAAPRTNPSFYLKTKQKQPQQQQLFNESMLD